MKEREIGRESKGSKVTQVDSGHSRVKSSGKRFWMEACGQESIGLGLN